MAKTKRRQAIDNAYTTLISGADQGQKVKEPHPLGVKLTAEEIQALDAIAGEIGLPRHQLLQYAVRDFLARYKRGERPKVVTKTVITLETD